MFRSKSRSRRIFTNRKPLRRHFSGLTAIVSVALFLLVLELLTRIFVDISGNRSKFAQADTSSEIAQAYKLQFVSRKSVKDNGKNSGNLSQALLAQPSVSVGYRLLGSQANKYWQINEQGFRDRDTVPVAKPPGEIRIVMLGSSTAFGYGSASNEATISEQLEQRLAQRLQQQQASPQLYQPDILPRNAVEKKKYLAKPAKIKSGKYRVINASVPGYASGNELAQMALGILKYKPDLILVLNGYEDLMLPSNEEATAVPQSDAVEDSEGLANYISQIIKPIENKSYLAKLVQKQWLNQQQDDDKADLIINEKTANLVRHLSTEKTELQKRVDRYIDNQKQMLSLSAASRVPLVVALQPEITGRNPSQLTEAEGKIAQELGRTYIKKVRADYPVLIEQSKQLAQAFPSNLKAVDLYQLTDKYPSPSFTDAVHLNQAANEKVAEQLYYAIASFSKMQIAPKPSPAIPAPKYRYQ